LINLTEKEKKLIEERLDFYCSLDEEKRTPNTEAQKHFVMVLRGVEKAKTDDEIAYQKYKSLKNSGSIIMSQGNLVSVNWKRSYPPPQKPYSPPIKDQFYYPTRKEQKPSRKKYKPLAAKVNSAKTEQKSIVQHNSRNSSVPDSSHIKDWMKPKGNSTMKRLDEMNKGYIPNNNWATDDDIKKESKANFKSSRKNKFF